ncbi:hypothetical protein QM083_26670 [Klebsiella pneumoniae]|nr:hypothetical protein [Klebsiella pneumoniae]MDV5722798.1 hypothetical protein [Klebsiella pneumoniae]
MLLLEKMPGLVVVVRFNNPSLTITEVAESDARRILGIPRSCTLQEIVVRDQVVTGVSGSGQGVIQVRDAVTLAGNRIPLLGDRILQRRQRLCICLIRQMALVCSRLFRRSVTLCEVLVTRSPTVLTFEVTALMAFESAFIPRAEFSWATFSDSLKPRLM